MQQANKNNQIRALLFSTHVHVYDTEKERSYLNSCDTHTPNIGFGVVTRLFDNFRRLLSDKE